MLAALMLLTCSAPAADFEITAYLWITNTPAGLSSNVTFNIGTATTRYWTNDATAAPSSNIQITNSTAASATNLVQHLTTYAVFSAGSGTPQLGVALSSSNTSVVVLTAPINTNLTVSFSGNWAKVAYDTNPLAPANPILNRTNAMSNPARTNAVNAIVDLLSAVTDPINVIPLGMKWLRNYVDTNAVQTVANKTLVSPVISGGTLTAANYSGYVTALTNGSFWSNIFWHATISNATLHAISGYITNVTIENITTNKMAKLLVTDAITIGGTSSPPAFLSGLTVVGTIPTLKVFGFSDTAANNPSIYTQRARGTEGSPTNMQAGDVVGDFQILGKGTTQYKIAMLWDVLAAADYSNSSADTLIMLKIGRTNAANAAEIVSWRWGRITNSADVFFKSNAVVSGTATIASLYALGGSVSNTLFSTLSGSNLVARDATLTGTNILNGRLDLVARNNTGLANGYNSGTILGTNAYLRLSGHSAAATNAGFAAPGGPAVYWVQVDNPGLSYTLLNESGLEATAANRILTGTGALVNSTNNPVMFSVLYDDAAARYRLLSFR